MRQLAIQQPANRSNPTISTMQSLSLFELNEHIRRVLALNFPEAIWVRAEVAQLNESRGHFYFSLVQKSEEGDSIIAKSEGVLWASQFRSLRRKHGKLLEELLQENLELLIKVNIDFHEQYGMKLIVEDIDPTFTYGKLAMQRQAILNELHKKKLLGRNSQLDLPTVLQKIAVLSNDNAAGYHDFINQLKSNNYGFHFDLKLFPIALQGVNVETETLNQLEKVKKRKKEFDCVVIIRGGGSKLDLAGFDSLEIAKAIAKFKLPVFTGIGHEIDESIADMVAHSSLKTPTAVAEFLITHNASFEEQLVLNWLQINQASIQVLQSAKLDLERITHGIQSAVGETIRNHSRMIDFISQEIPALTKNRLKNENSKLNHLAQITDSLSLEKTLQRGYSITMKKGKTIMDASKLSKGDELETRFKKGKIKSSVKK